MWNTTVDNSVSNTNINTPASGIIQKSNIDSFFLHFHMKSSMANDILNKSKPEYFIDGEEKEIAVLQVLLTGNDYLMVEVVDKCKL